MQALAVAPSDTAPRADERAGSGRLYAGAVYLWTGAAGSALAGFAFWAMATRLYAPQQIGLGAAGLSALSLIAMMSHLGLGLGLIRFAPERGRDAPRLVNAALTAGALVAVLCAAVFLVGLPVWAPRLAFLREQPLYAVAFVSFAAAGAVSTMQAQALMACRKAAYVPLQIGAVQLVRLALPPLLAVFFGAFGIIAAGGISLGLGALAGFALLGLALPGYRPRPLLDRQAVLGLLPFSAANYAADMLLLAPGLLLPLLVVGLSGAVEAGYFYTAWFLAYLLTAVSANVALSLFAEASRDRAALDGLSRSAARAALAVAVAGAVVLVLAGDKLLLAFGADYAREGAGLLRLVALAAIPAAIVNVYLGALRAAGRIAELVAIAAVVAATSLGLSVALLPVAGIEGAGVAQLAGQGAGAVIVAGRLVRAESPMGQRVRWLLAALVARC